MRYVQVTVIYLSNDWIGEIIVEQTEKRDVNSFNLSSTIKG